MKRFSEQKKMKNKIFLLFEQFDGKKENSSNNVQKKNEFPYSEMSLDNDDIKKLHVTKTKKATYMSKELKMQNIFIHKRRSLLPATSFQSRSHMAYNTIAF